MKLGFHGDFSHCNGDLTLVNPDLLIRGGVPSKSHESGIIQGHRHISKQEFIHLGST